MATLRQPSHPHAASGLDQHTAAHLHMEGVAEPVAVIPVHTGSVGDEGDRRGLLRPDLHADAMVHDDEAVGHVLDLIEDGAVGLLADIKKKLGV